MTGSRGAGFSRSQGGGPGERFMENRPSAQAGFFLPPFLCLSFLPLFVLPLYCPSLSTTLGSAQQKGWHSRALLQTVNGSRVLIATRARWSLRAHEVQPPSLPLPLSYRHASEFIALPVNTENNCDREPEWR